MVKLDSETKAVYIKTALIVGVVLIAVGMWLWWQFIYTSPKNVFNSMLKSSLSTHGVTRTISSKQDAGSFEQLSQTTFGETNITEVKTTISQKTEAGDTKVVTTTLASPKDNYVKYSDIQVTPQNDKPAPDFSDLLNVWGKQSDSEGGQQVYIDSVYGAILFGHLSNARRNELINLIREQEVYKVDFSKVATEKVNKKSAFVYEIEINVKAYIELLKKYEAMTGLSATEGIDPSMHEASAPIKVKAYVDKRSHQLLKLSYEGGQDQIFSGYGIKKSPKLPAKAISRQELESQLEAILNK